MFHLFEMLYHVGESGPFGVVANTIQNFCGLLGAIVWRLHQCRVWYCPCFGRHKIAGTTWKVCGFHHKQHHHDRLRDRHAAKHPHRLGHGES